MTMTDQANSDRGSFIWYELMTTDADAATRFYGDVVGWTIGAPSPDSAFDYRMIERGDGGHNGGVLALTEEMSANGAKPVWVGYVCTPDIDAALAEATGRGATVMTDRGLEGVGRMAFLTDPQGALIYLMAPTPPAGDPEAKSDVFSVDQPQHMRWNELTVPDDEAAVSFYTSLFGWTQERAMPMGELGDYRFITHGGVDIGAVMRKAAFMPHLGWTHYIGVDDIDRAAAAVKAGGGETMGEPQEIPGGEFSLHARDPQGAFFALVGPRR
jgi:uncharacterized protein